MSDQTSDPQIPTDDGTEVETGSGVPSSELPGMPGTPEGEAGYSDLDPKTATEDSQANDPR